MKYNGHFGNTSEKQTHKTSSIFSNECHKYLQFCKNDGVQGDSDLRHNPDA